MWELILLVICAGTCVSQSCSSSQANLLTFSIKNERNVTGNWNAQVELKRRAAHNESGPWQIDLEHSTEKCERFDDVKILASISVPLEDLYLSPKPPGPGYGLIPGLGYYKFHPELKTWFQARDICQQEGAHLVIINSQREANALLHFWVPHQKIVSDWRNDWAYVGVHDQYVEGEYVTIYGDLLNSTGNEEWHPGQPDKLVTENCVVVDRSKSRLGDVSCAVQLAFFCEQELRN